MGQLNWIYKEQDFTDDMIDDNYGFVYIITNQITNKKYIGKKFFYSSKTKQVKGKKKKTKVPSDWQTYYGSNEDLKKDVIMHGKESFRREILHLCKSKGVCGYLEAKEQFINEALESEDYYNSWVSCKIHKAHVFGKVVI